MRRSNSRAKNLIDTRWSVSMMSDNAVVNFIFVLCENMRESNQYALIEIICAIFRMNSCELICNESKM